MIFFKVSFHHILNTGFFPTIEEYVWAVDPDTLNFFFNSIFNIEQ